MKKTSNIYHEPALFGKNMALIIGNFKRILLFFVKRVDELSKYVVASKYLNGEGKLLQSCIDFGYKRKLQ